MKYFLKFEGQEKLLIKFILVSQVIVIVLLIMVAMDVPDLHLSDNQLEALCQVSN